MADSWTVTAIDRDHITITYTVEGVTRTTAFAVDQLKPFATVADAAAKIRAILVETRAGLLAQKTIPAKLAAAVGYAEVF